MIIESNSIEQTHAIAQDLVKQLNAPTVLAFFGDLGAGKTCFIQGVARALDIQRPVTSPTFTIINEYRDGRWPLYHIDLYRIHSEDEALDLGLDDYIYGTGITAIEWSERIEGLLPDGTIRISLECGETPDDRIIRIEGQEDGQ